MSEVPCSCVTSVSAMNGVLVGCSFRIYMCVLMCVGVWVWVWYVERCEWGVVCGGV